MIRRHLLALSALMVCLAAPRPAVAASPEPFDPVVESVWWGSTLVMAGAGYWLGSVEPLFDEPLIGGPTSFPHGENTVPEWTVAAAHIAVLGTVGLVPNDGGFWNRKSYRLVQGFTGAVATNLFLTNLVKVIVGRKRPDYDDRVEQGADLVEGRYSFFSGHTSHSFLAATYLSWFLVDTLWDEGTWGKVTSLTLSAGLMGTAAWVGWSRTDDHRHHPSDVITGALVGTGIATGFYFLANALDGGSDDGGQSLTLGAFPMSIALMGTF